jgi:hypothetical protein
LEWGCVGGGTMKTAEYAACAGVLNGGVRGGFWGGEYFVGVCVASHRR